MESHLHPRLGEQPGGEFGVEGRGHGDDGEVLGGDAPVLARHVRVQRVPRLRHRAAEDAAVPRTHLHEQEVLHDDGFWLEVGD